MSLDRLTHPRDRATVNRDKVKPSTEPSGYASLEAAARYYDVSPRTVRRAIADGDLSAVRIGRQIRIAWADLEALAKPVPVADFDEDGA